MNRIRRKFKLLTKKKFRRVRQKYFKDAKLDTCPNCETEIKGRYCYNCGQSTKHYNRPFSLLVYDAFGDFFAFDERLLKTIVPLTFKPGFLVKEFFKGKRVRYVSPIKLYIFMSFISFLLIKCNTENYIKQNTNNNEKINLDTISNDKYKNIITQIETKKAYCVDLKLEKNELKKESRLLLKKANKIGRSKDKTQFHIKDSLMKLYNFYDNKIDNLEDKIDELKDTISELKEWVGFDYESSEIIVKGDTLKVVKRNSNDPSSIFTKLIDGLNIELSYVQEQDLSKKIQRYKREPKLLANDTLSYMSKVMFVLLPIFSLILLLFYIRRKHKFLFINHLLFSLNFHTFAFYFFAITEFVRFCGYNLVSEYPSILFIIPLYLLLSIKKYYNQGWGKTILKFLLLDILYGIFLSVGIITAFVLVFS